LIQWTSGKAESRPTWAVTGDVWPRCLIVTRVVLLRCGTYVSVDSGSFPPFIPDTIGCLYFVLILFDACFLRVVLRYHVRSIPFHTTTHRAAVLFPFLPASIHIYHSAILPPTPLRYHDLPPVLPAHSLHSHHHGVVRCTLLHYILEQFVALLRWSVCVTLISILHCSNSIIWLFWSPVYRWNSIYTAFVVPTFLFYLFLVICCSFPFYRYYHRSFWFRPILLHLPITPSPFYDSTISAIWILRCNSVFEFTPFVRFTLFDGCIPPLGTFHWGYLSTHVLPAYGTTYVTVSFTGVVYILHFIPLQFTSHRLPRTFGWWFYFYGATTIITYVFFILVLRYCTFCSPVPLMLLPRYLLPFHCSCALPSDLRYCSADPSAGTFLISVIRFVRSDVRLLFTCRFYLMRWALRYVLVVVIRCATFLTFLWFLMSTPPTVTFVTGDRHHYIRDHTFRRFGKFFSLPRFFTPAFTAFRLRCRLNRLPPCCYRVLTYWHYYSPPPLNWVYHGTRCRDRYPFYRSHRSPLYGYYLAVTLLIPRFSFAGHLVTLWLLISAFPT